MTRRQKQNGIRLKVDSLSREQICAGSEFQVDVAETEIAREEKLVVMLEGLARRLELKKRKALGDSSGWDVVACARE